MVEILLSKKTTKHYDSFAKGVNQLNNISDAVSTCLTDIGTTRSTLKAKKTNYVNLSKDIILKSKRK